MEITEKIGEIINYPRSRNKEGVHRFRKAWFQPIKQRKFWNKPHHGFWGSPENSEWGWKDWALIEMCGEWDMRRGTRFRLKPGSKVYVIDSLRDLYNVPHILTERFEGSLLGPEKFINFKRMSKEYDAIWLTYRGLNDTRRFNSYYNNIYSERFDTEGWDVETVLVMNSKAIQYPKVHIQGLPRKIGKEVYLYSPSGLVWNEKKLLRGEGNGRRFLKLEGSRKAVIRFIQSLKYYVRNGEELLIYENNKIIGKVRISY